MNDLLYIIIIINIIVPIKSLIIIILFSTIINCQCSIISYNAHCNNYYCYLVILMINNKTNFGGVNVIMNEDNIENLFQPFLSLACIEYNNNIINFIKESH